MFRNKKLKQLNSREILGKEKEFFDLKINVFRNKTNGQQMATFPKKILKDLPSEMKIRIPWKYFKRLNERRH